MKRRTVTQKMDAQLFDTIKISLPVVVVPTFLHFIDPGLPLSDRRVTIFDSRGKQELRQHCANGLVPQTNTVLPTDCKWRAAVPRTKSTKKPRLGNVVPEMVPRT